MFIQFRPWLDCDRHCSFCYLNEKDRSMPIKQKQRSLMLLSGYLHDTSKGFDTLGLIGGELFNDDSLYTEWTCVAEAIRNSDHISRVFIGTHLLMQDVSLLIDFAYMTGKEVQICTSYDSVGRFKGDYELWVQNVKEVQKEGFKVVCSATLTQQLMEDDLSKLPEGIDFKIQPIFVSEEWLEDFASVCNLGDYYNAHLNADMKENVLAKREDVLKFFNQHKDIAKDYSTYSDKHATILYDYKEPMYEKKPFVCTNHLAKCGHPLIAYCYKDSYRCTMCDAKMVSE